MTARRCFNQKIAAGLVNRRAGDQILDMMDAFEREYQATLGPDEAARQAALDTAAAVKAATARKADLINRSIIAQSRVLRVVKEYDGIVNGRAGWRRPVTIKGFRPRFLGGDVPTTFEAVRSLLMRDPFELATWANVDKLAQDIRGRAHAGFAAAIETLRPKMLGLKAEATMELDTLRALYGRTDVHPDALAAAQAFGVRVAPDLAKQFRDAGGALAERKDWRLPNPMIDPLKVRTGGAEPFKVLVREHADRQAMLDYDTGKPLTDAKFELLISNAYDLFQRGFAEGPPTGAVRGRRMLANSRDFSRVFVWKSAESWQAIADQIGAHASPFQSMLDHIAGMSTDIAMMRVLGPNPEATRRFIMNLFDRDESRLAVTAEADAKSAKSAYRRNERIGGWVGGARKNFDAAWAEITNLNDVPVNRETARFMGDMRSALVASQMGSAIVSSITDVATVTMTARFNGLPATQVIARATKMMGEPGSEIFAAQQGLIADSLADTLRSADRLYGETIRSGRLAKMGSAVIRASGLRRWTASLRNAFGLEMMAHAARERGKKFAELDGDFRGAFARVGIGADHWDAIRNTPPAEPRPLAILLRPMDVRGSPLANEAGEKFAQLINTQMDYAVIERDPVTRALLLGDSQPGTARGEFWRAAGMYKMFPTAVLTLHGARMFAKGFDGKRLSHGALTFVAMSLLGVLAMQAKNILAGRDPQTLDPRKEGGLRSWGAAMLQGGGLGVFGDMLFIDQTRYGNSWASVLAGPQFAAAESVLGDFLLKNITLAARGEETHFLGDALYAGARFIPGSNLWYAKAAFQRGILDQLALALDDRAPERFRRIEKNAKKFWGQEMFWPPGQALPERAPEVVE